MSDEKKWLRRIERELGHPLSQEELAEFEKLKPQVDRIMAKIKADREASAIKWMKAAAPYVAFMQKLKARQGTSMPDFGALYKRKAELDRRIPDEPPA